MHHRIFVIVDEESSLAARKAVFSYFQAFCSRNYRHTETWSIVPDWAVVGGWWTGELVEIESGWAPERNKLSQELSAQYGWTWQFADKEHPAIVRFLEARAKFELPDKEGRNQYVHLGYEDDASLLTPSLEAYIRALPPQNKEKYEEPPFLWLSGTKTYQRMPTKAPKQGLNRYVVVVDAHN